MSTDMTLRIHSTSSDNTEQLAALVGSKLKGGEAIELVSDLGGGKTTFVRGLARGLGSSDKVSSPSFTLSNEYRAGNLALFHFDFYRLVEPGIMRDELAEVLAEPKAVVVVEWGGIVEDVLPPERLTISIKTTGETTRELTFSCPEELTYIVEGIQ